MPGFFSSGTVSSGRQAGARRTILPKKDPQKMPKTHTNHQKTDPKIYEKGRPGTSKTIYFPCVSLQKAPQQGPQNVPQNADGKSTQIAKKMAPEMTQI